MGTDRQGAGPEAGGRTLTRVLVAATALVVAAIFVAISSAPSAHPTLASPFDDGTVRGTLHVHSSQSDGRGTPETIAAAAADAGLAFVVLTDHGDATRVPDPPVYIGGVLMINAVEISTAAGHYIALDMPPAPYPLGGEGRDVVEDVSRLGGFGIVAHPDSPKAPLAWGGRAAPYDGIEVVNLDTAWRRRVAAPGFGARVGLAGDVLGALLRAPETIAALADPGPVLAEWAEAARRRRVVIVAGSDAHGGVGPLPIPGYGTAFRALSVHVRPDLPLGGEAVADAGSILGGIRGGHLYVALDGLATPAAFTFTATTADGDIEGGDEVAAGEPLTLRVRSNAPAGFATTIWRDAEPLGPPSTRPDVAASVDGAPAVYRVSIAPIDASAGASWVLSNPIYVRAPTRETVAEPAAQTASDATVLFRSIEDVSRWWVETDETSVAAVDPAQGAGAGAAAELRFRWGLPDAPPARQYAALVGESGQGATLGGTRLVFEARSEQPARVAVELRVYRPDQPGPRWLRSVYLDPEWRTYSLPFSTFTPPAGAATLPAEGFRSVMFVVNTVHTPLGASGRFAFRDVRTE